MRPLSRRGRWLYTILLCFSAGAVADGLLRIRADARALGSAVVDDRIGPAAGESIGLPRAPVDGAKGRRTRATETRATTETIGPQPDADRVDASKPPIAALQARDLQLPIDGASVGALKGQFDQGRDAGRRAHEAVDILAPRNTPVRAVEDGTIAKLFLSKAGGITIYQFDPSGRFCYYYAHLERYAEALHEGQHVSRGEVIGYVGTSGNAPPNTPHLHFAISELGSDRSWWRGVPLDPYPIFQSRG